MRYTDLRILPLINGVTVLGQRKLSDYGLVPMSADDINNIMLEVFGYLL